MASGSGDGSNNNTEIPRGLINRSGNPIGRGSRLPSLKGQRDLTLGGIQRKVFTPNLAALKKPAAKDEASKPIQSPKTNDHGTGGKGKGRGKGDRTRGRGRGRGEDRTIQLSSAFAQGPMGGEKSGWSRGGAGASFGGGGGGGSGGGGAGNSREKEAESLRINMKQDFDDDEDEQKTLDQLKRDDFMTDIASGDDHLKPVKIPLNFNNVAIKPEIKVELTGEDAMDTDEKSISPTKHIPDTKPAHMKDSKRKKEKVTVSDIFKNATKSEKGELMLIQFPDTLPGLPTEIEDGAKSSSEADISSRLSKCQLKDCNEGFVGKLRIRKSGKAELCLGDNVMAVLPGRQVNYHQELASIDTQSASGKMVVLGAVNHKLVVTPQYTSLLKSAHTF